RELLPNRVGTHVARDPAGKRQPEFHLPAPTSHEPIKPVTLAIHANRYRNRSFGDDATFRKLLFGHKVLPDQSCPRGRCKFDRVWNSQKLGSNSDRRLQARESLHDIPQLESPTVSAGKSMRCTGSFYDADLKHSLAIRPVAGAMCPDRKSRHSSSNAMSHHQSEATPNPTPEIHRNPGRR